MRNQRKWNVLFHPLPVTLFQVCDPITNKCVASPFIASLASHHIAECALFMTKKHRKDAIAAEIRFGRQFLIFG